MTLLQELQAKIWAKSTPSGTLLFLSATSRLSDSSQGEYKSVCAVGPFCPKGQFNAQAPGETPSASELRRFE